MKIRNVCGNPVHIGNGRIIRNDEVAEVVEDETVKALIEQKAFVKIETKR